MRLDGSYTKSEGAYILTLPYDWNYIIQYRLWIEKHVQLLDDILRIYPQNFIKYIRLDTEESRVCRLGTELNIGAPPDHQPHNLPFCRRYLPGR